MPPPPPPASSLPTQSDVPAQQVVQTGTLRTGWRAPRSSTCPCCSANKLSVADGARHRLYVLLDGRSDAGGRAQVLPGQSRQRVDLGLGVERQLGQAGDVALHKLHPLGHFHRPAARLPGPGSGHGPAGPCTGCTPHVCASSVPVRSLPAPRSQPASLACAETVRRARARPSTARKALLRAGQHGQCSPRRAPRRTTGLGAGLSAPAAKGSPQPRQT